MRFSCAAYVVGIARQQSENTIKNSAFRPPAETLEVSDREDPLACMIRCTADLAKADKRTRSKWSRLMRYAVCDPAASRCRPAHRCIESITMWRHALLTDERTKWTEAHLDRSNRPIRRR